MDSKDRKFVPPSPFVVLPSRCLTDERFMSGQHLRTFQLLVILCSFGNRGSVAYPSQALLAKAMGGISQAGVSKHIKLLMQWGYIRYASKKFHKNLKGNAYFIFFEEQGNNPITEEEVFAMQKAEHQDELIDQMKIEPPTEPKMKDDKKPSREARNICLMYTRILNKHFGQVAHTYTQQHEALVQTWLDSGYTKDQILKRIEDYMIWRRNNGKDGIKSIAYFKNVFDKNKKKPSNPKEELEGLMNKFVNTHKVKF